MNCRERIVAARALPICQVGRRRGQLARDAAGLISLALCPAARWAQLWGLLPGVGGPGGLVGWVRWSGRSF